MIKIQNMQIHMVSYKSWEVICMWRILNIVANTVAH